MKTKFEQFNENEEQQYVPVMKKDDITAYVDEAEMIRFIEANSNMNWNRICKYIREVGICSEEGKTYWRKDYLLKNYKTEATEWVLAFFEAHPWIGNKMMLCFDD